VPNFSGLDELANAASLAMVENSTDATFAIDGALTVIGWNPAAEELTGYSATEVIDQHCSIVLQAIYSNGEPLCVPGCEGVRCFDRIEPFNAPSCSIQHKDGTFIPVNLDAVALSQQIEHAESCSATAVIFLRSAKQKPQNLKNSQILQISTFGRFGLAAGGSSLTPEKWDRKQALMLLKFLLTRLGRVIHREVLIENLWPDADEKSGRARLKVNVHALRRELRSAGIPESILETVGDAYTLRREGVWVDAVMFETCIATGANHQQKHEWTEAIEHFVEAQRLYRGDYLEEDIHAEWCAEERDRLREVYLDMLANMALCHAHLGDYAEAVSVGRIVLVDDPCREHIHRMIMEYLVKLGHGDSAVAQYHHCKVVLARELGVEPSRETRRLYDKIISGELDNLVQIRQIE
jgi:PAS domain S-box-containing protein